MTSLSKIFYILIVLVIGTLFIFPALYKNEVTIPKEYIEFDGIKYKLSFYDDFNGTKLDKRMWSVCPKQKRQNTGGYWDASAISLDGRGNLVITSYINDKNVPISGGIRTKGKFEQAKGYFEIRCKLQSAPGFWSAFWLMCNEQKKVGNGATDGAEIDVFEAFNVKTKEINHAIHWDGYAQEHRQIAESVIAENCYDGNYHTFSMLWTDNAYIFYIDGTESYRLSESDSFFPGSNTEPTYLKISTEFGTWAGIYDSNKLPDSFVVDYVKVYTSEF